MSVEFVGYTNVQHVQQPEDSELCFAAIIASVSGAEINEADAALQAAHISQADGSTAALPFHKEVKVADSVVAIDPFEQPETFEKMLEQLNEAFVAGQAVAVAYKKYGDPKNRRYHWKLLTGYYAENGERGEFNAVHTIDPQDSRPTHLGIHILRQMFTRSQPPEESEDPFSEPAQGVFLQSLSLIEPEAAEAVA